MEDKEFFDIYLEALNKALDNDNVNYGFSVYNPNDYIEDELLLKKLESFEEMNYERFKNFFDLVSFYFDAKSHYFDSVGKFSIDEYRKKLIEASDTIKKRF